MLEKPVNPNPLIFGLTDLAQLEACHSPLLNPGAEIHVLFWTRDDTILFYEVQGGLHIFLAMTFPILVTVSSESSLPLLSWSSPPLANTCLFVGALECPVFKWQRKLYVNVFNIVMLGSYLFFCNFSKCRLTIFHIGKCKFIPWSVHENRISERPLSYVKINGHFIWFLNYWSMLMLP